MGNAVAGTASRFGESGPLSRPFGSILDELGIDRSAALVKPALTNEVPAAFAAAGDRGGALLNDFAVEVDVETLDLDLAW